MRNNWLYRTRLKKEYGDKFKDWGVLIWELKR
jgi:hypothetical protein